MCMLLNMLTCTYIHTHTQNLQRRNTYDISRSLSTSSVNAKVSSECGTSSFVQVGINLGTKIELLSFQG